MKKLFTIILCLCLLCAMLCGCGAKPAENTEKNDPAPAAKETEAPKQDSTPTAGVPNPVTSYDSLDEINELTGGHLCHPPVMGVTDESFSVIKGSSYDVAQYRFTVGGVNYTYRFCADTSEDISGMYVGNGTLFSEDLKESRATRAFQGGIGSRYCNEDGQYVLIGESETGVNEDMFRSVSDELFVLTTPQSADPDVFLGSWHDNIAGRGVMDVTQMDGHLVFDVRWSDSAYAHYVWTFCGLPDADGVLRYEGGFYGKAEFDTNGKESKMILDEDASGTVEVTADGTMLWTENGETHEFVKDSAVPQAGALNAFPGSWHDNIAGRGMMDVTLVDGQLVFDVRWSDSAYAYYVWSFCGTPDASGVLNYDGGFYGKVELDADNKETKKIIDEAAAGTVEIAADGTMLWTENGETHEFVKEAALNAFLGSWYDSIAGRGMMDVTPVDGQLVFDVRWSDSASAYYVWSFCGTPDADGILTYDGGFYGKVEFDASSKETKTILDEDAAGTVEIAADGTMLWTENGETHKFVKDN